MFSLSHCVSNGNSNNMHCLQSWKKSNVIIALIIVTYCQALQQEIGEECTNENGIVGVCQFSNNCPKDTNLGVTCNSEQTIICCAENILKDKQQFNSSNDQPIQSRFSFIPDFFHAPTSLVKPKSNINFFNHQKQNIPNLVGNVLNHNVNTMQFVEDRPYQNFEQDAVTKPNKQKHTSTRPTNEYKYYTNNNNQNLNTGNVINSDQTTRKFQSYEINISNQNTNSYYSNYQTSQNNVPYYHITQRPSENQNNMNPSNHEKYQSNQNNNFNRNPNYYTSTQDSNYNSRNHEYNSQQRPFAQISSNNKRNQYNNYHSTGTNILFPGDKFNTKFTMTTTTSYGPNENEKRISEIKCEEYSKILTTTVSALPLEIDTAPRPVSVEVCDSKSVGLIVGGSKAELGEFPHMVAIGFRAKYGNPWNCGGTLISERFVLTAAHCTNTTLGNPVRIRLGELNLQKNNDRANPIDILVDKIIVHPDYISTSKYNDIALIRLSSTVKFSNHIRPACLYNLDNIYSRKVTATGWGSIEYGSVSSDDLLKVNLDVIDNRRCNKLYEAESKTNTLNRGIINSMICAGDLAGGHDTCLGDSGGPLVIRSEKNTCVFNLVGITSFGKFCAAENSPGVYTKVSTFLPWIEQIVWP